VRSARVIVAALRVAAATTLAAAALSACATEAPTPTDPCAKAVERLTDECHFTVDGADGGAELNCSGATACAADCLFTSPCIDIKNNGPAFADCIAAGGP
jgi:hypothetical protein